MTAPGGQGQRAADMLEKLMAQGPVAVSNETIAVVFGSLAKGKEGERAAQLLQVCASVGMHLLPVLWWLGLWQMMNDGIDE